MSSRSLTEAEIAEFVDDGVVCVRDAVSATLAASMLAAVDDLIGHSGGGLSRGGLDRRVYAVDPRFHSFVVDSGLAALAGQAMSSERVRIYFDQIFTRAPEAANVFPWHQDQPYWPITGSQVCSTWVALTASTVAGSALEFVAGSHRWGVTFRPVFNHLGETATELDAIWPGLGGHVAGFPDQVPDVEADPDRYRILGFDVEPGDALLFDYRVLHRSRANTTPQRRGAISYRWLGDDARWNPVPGADPVIGAADTWLQPGELISDDATFPCVHHRASV